MNKLDLYLKIQELAPYTISGSMDFRERMSKSLSNYLKLIKDLDENEKLDNWVKHIKNISNIVDKLKDIVTFSYKGLPSTAYQKLSNLLKSYQDGIIMESVTPNSFYRMRIFKDRRTNISYAEMFHIPIDMRGIVSTQRYSTPGFPCLYMGKSIYACWEELGRPILNECWVSRIDNITNLELVDLRLPDQTKFIEHFEKYIYLMPLIISCMHPVKNTCDIYKPEYIIPQLIIEWVIKNKKDGIFYTSTHKNRDFDFPDSKIENVAIPIKSPLQKLKYCERLINDFKISNPQNNEIERLKEIRKNDGGGADMEARDILYNSTEFAYLEQRLENAPLYKIENSK